MLRRRLQEHRQFQAWEDHLHHLEDLRRPYLEEATEPGATAIQEEIVEWLHRLN
jgi:hypothetical protein